MIKWYVEAAENLFTIFINILSPYKITHMWWLSNDVVKWYVEAAENLIFTQDLSSVWSMFTAHKKSSLSHIFKSLRGYRRLEKFTL